MTELSEDDAYLIWSHEHGRWWGPFGRGYVQKTAEAGRYSREQALKCCVSAIPGTTHRLRALPELPVRLADIEAMRGIFSGGHPVGMEWWREAD